MSAKPAAIVQRMSCQSLTRQQVASHLQRYGKALPWTDAYHSALEVRAPPESVACWRCCTASMALGPRSVSCLCLKACSALQSALELAQLLLEVQQSSGMDTYLSPGQLVQSIAAKRRFWSLVTAISLIWHI